MLNMENTQQEPSSNAQRIMHDRLVLGTQYVQHQMRFSKLAQGHACASKLRRSAEGSAHAHLGMVVGHGGEQVVADVCVSDVVEHHVQEPV